MTLADLINTLPLEALLCLLFVGAFASGGVLYLIERRREK